MRQGDSDAASCQGSRARNARKKAAGEAGAAPRGPDGMAGGPRAAPAILAHGGRSQRMTAFHRHAARTQAALRADRATATRKAAATRGGTKRCRRAWREAPFIIPRGPVLAGRRASLGR